MTGEDAGPTTHQPIRPMPVPDRPETHRYVGDAAKSLAGETGMRPMPRPKRPKPPLVVHHES